MAIFKMENWKVTGCNKLLGFSGENSTEEIIITCEDLDTTYDYYLDVGYDDDGKNIIALTKSEGSLEALLTADMLGDPGMKRLQVRAVKDTTTVKKSNEFLAYTDTSVNATEFFPDPLPSEFEQYETHIRHLIESVDPDAVCTPESFGAVGDGLADDTAALQAAVNTGACIGTRGAKYRITSTIDISGKRVDFNGASIVLGKKVGLSTHGTEKTPTTLTADVSEGNMIQVADASKIEAGDIIVLRDSDPDHRFSVERDYYYNGGVFLVSEIRNNSVSVSPGIEWTHYAGSEVLVITPTTCEVTGLAGVESINTDGMLDCAINLFETISARVHDCDIDTDAYITVLTTWSIGAKMDHMNIRVSPEMHTRENAYGIMVGPSSYTHISDCVIKSPWSCISVSGGMTNLGQGIGGALPVQYTAVDNCVLTLTSQRQADAAGYGDHSNAYRTKITRTVMQECCVKTGAVLRDCEIISRIQSTGSLSERTCWVQGSSLPNLRPPIIFENVSVYGTICIFAEESRIIPGGEYDTYLGNVIFENVTGKTGISGTIKPAAVELRSKNVHIDTITVDGGTIETALTVKDNSDVGVLTVRNQIHTDADPDMTVITGNIKRVVLENLYFIIQNAVSYKDVLSLRATGADYMIHNVDVAYMPSYDIHNSVCNIKIESGHYTISNMHTHGCVFKKLSSDNPLDMMVANSVIDLHSSMTSDTDITWHTTNSFQVNGTPLPGSGGSGQDESLCFIEFTVAQDQSATASMTFAQARSAWYAGKMLLAIDDSGTHGDNYAVYPLVFISDSMMEFAGFSGGWATDIVFNDDETAEVITTNFYNADEVDEIIGELGGDA